MTRTASAIRAARDTAELTQKNVDAHNMESKGVDSIDRVLSLERLFHLPQGTLFYEAGIVPNAPNPDTATLETHINNDTTINAATQQILLSILNQSRKLQTLEKDQK